MNLNPGAGTARQFVARPPFWGSKMASVTTPAWQRNPFGSWLVMAIGVFAFTAVAGLLFVGLGSTLQGQSDGVLAAASYGFRYGGVALIIGGAYLWYRRSQRKRVVLSVTADGLTVDGVRYPFAGATLGTWGVTGGVTYGVALHVDSGGRRFVLGGRDRRVAPGTRLDAPDVGYGLPIDIDAWLPAAEFDEILAAAGHGLNARQPSPDQAIRCLLYPNALLIQEMGAFATRRKREFLASAGQPRLAIDVEPNGIRVVDPSTGAVLGAAALADVSATPVTYQPSQWHVLPTVGHVISDMATAHWSTMPGLYIAIPGLAPLTVGSMDTNTGLDRRFAWSAVVPTQDARAEYQVSGTDWQTLIERFGLAGYLA